MKNKSYKREYTYSVCLASYNGERYIEDQITSIMRQLDERDELIVSDDGSTDNTLEILNDLKKNYNNIMVIKGPQKGHSCNFGNAAQHASKDIVLFSDQDDIWLDNKLDIIDNVFHNNQDCTTILHTMNTFYTRTQKKCEISIVYHKGFIRNYVKSCYWGCCMGVKTDFLKEFLPFRDQCVGHDQLIGLLTEKYGKCVFVEKPLIWHRLHGNNTSHKRTIKEMIVFRMELLKDYQYERKKYSYFGK